MKIAHPTIAVLTYRILKSTQIFALVFLFLPSSIFALKSMNILLLRCYFIIGAMAFLSFPLSTTAQTLDSDQLPPSPGAEGYRPAAIDYSATTGYRVIIPGDNPSLLAQAKALEPTAFLQTLNGQRFIQVGLYGNESIARQQVSRFQSQGMPVIIQGSGVQNPSALPNATPSALPNLSAPSQLPSTYSNSNPNVLPVVQTTAKGYYVIVPTQPGDVNFVQSQLNQLGIPSQYIFLRDRPFGMHHAIGVFSQRSQADTMASLIRSRGSLDSRVHYER